jgi:hypothetical protein
MSLALPAELNGYPGPRRFLELAGKLDLTPEQLARTRSLFAEMQAGAKAVGTRVIESERLQRIERHHLHRVPMTTSGSHVTMPGKTVMSAIQSTIRQKNGIDA